MPLLRKHILAVIVGLLVLSPAAAQAQAQPSSSPTVTLPCLRDDTRAESAGSMSRCADFVRLTHAVLFTEWVEHIAAQDQAAALARAHNAVARAAQVGVSRPTTRSSVSVNGTGSVNGYPCGGNLPPCYVLNRESHGTPTAENSRSTAAGLWQMLIGTSNNVARAMGRPDLVGVPASHWSPADQTAGAAVLWANGDGCSNWSAC